jgi:hypothetical protein
VKALQVLSQGWIGVKYPICVEANDDFELRPQFLVPEHVLEHAFILKLRFDEICLADLEHVLDKLVKQPVTLLLYTILLLFRFLLPTRFRKHYQVFTTALLTNYLHHLALLNGLLITTVVLQYFRL